MSRLFTFGCSFTNYRWSTWADILGAHYTEYQNWGQSGAGNHYIFNSVMEADQRNQFSAGDTVIVCWTTSHREDRYTDRWQTLGNIYYTDIYSREYKQTITNRGCLIRDIAFIKAVKILLENKPGVNWKFISIHNMQNWDLWRAVRPADHDVVDVYQDVFDCIGPNFRETLFPEQWPDREDPHPTPAEHLLYLDKVMPGCVTDLNIRATIAHETEHLAKNRTGKCNLPRL
jgi:hypothetical protein